MYLKTKTSNIERSCKTLYQYIHQFTTEMTQVLTLQTSTLELSVYKLR